VNALQIALDVGLGFRINTVMQTVYFKLSGVLPEDEAIQLIKDYAKKTFETKGMDIVEMNWKAIDAAVAAIEKVEVPDEITKSYVLPDLIPADATDFEKDVILDPGTELFVRASKKEIALAHLMSKRKQFEITGPAPVVNPADVLGPIKPGSKKGGVIGNDDIADELELPPGTIPLMDINQSSLVDFSAEGNESIRIITDTREFNSNVAKALMQNNVKVESLQLGAGDYIISERVAVERKRTEDLIESLIDGRLFSQLKKLKGLYLNPILVIEGTNLFSEKNLQPNSVSGALASIVTDFRIPIINTKNERETVKLLISLARREQLGDKRSSYSARPDKGKFSFQEQQQFIIEGLPNISSVMAQRLLTHFGSVGAIFNASVEELCKVKGVGKKTAEELRKVIDEKYQ
jgi:ERCC4-type nuclease